MIQSIKVLMILILVQVPLPVFSMKLPTLKDHLKIQKYGMQKELQKGDEIVALVQDIALQIGKTDPIRIVVGKNDELDDVGSILSYKEDVVIVPGSMENTLRHSITSGDNKEQQSKYRFLGSLLHEFGHLKYEKNTFQELHYGSYNPSYWNDSQCVLSHMKDKNLSVLLDQFAERLQSQPTALLNQNFTDILIRKRGQESSLDEKYSNRLLEAQADNFACLRLEKMQNREQAIAIAQARADEYRALHDVYAKYSPHVNEGKGTHPAPQLRADQFQKFALFLKQNAVVNGIEGLD